MRFSREVKASNIQRITVTFLGSILTNSSVRDYERIESYHALAHWILIVHCWIKVQKYAKFAGKKGLSLSRLGSCAQQRVVGFRSGGAALDGDQYSAL
jgi:hypothetical protein